MSKYDLNNLPRTAGEIRDLMVEVVLGIRDGLMNDERANKANRLFGKINQEMRLAVRQRRDPDQSVIAEYLRQVICLRDK